MTSQQTDAYLAAVPPDQRKALEKLRAQIAALLPDATETISYGMPAFAIDGRAVIWFAAWKSHLSIYPLTDSFLAANKDALEGFGRTKGSLHFTTERPLPDALVEGFVRARLADVESGAG